MAFSVRLCNEAILMSALTASTSLLNERGRPRSLTRNEAILVGLIVRLSKLLAGLTDVVCKNRLELCHIFSRCISESTINIRYLVEYGTDSLFDEYVESSLREEKRFLMFIERNIAKRGRELPIEARMRRSIMRAFQRGGLTLDQVNERKFGGWGGSIFQKAKKVGLESAYSAMIGLASHSVHGNWQELHMYHLEQDNTGFRPSLDWNPPRPQLLNGMCILTHEACSNYVSTQIASPGRAEFLSVIHDYPERVRMADAAHERFMQGAAR